jgi:hypothetical protein
MLFIGMYLSSEFQFGSRIAFDSVQADQSIRPAFPQPGCIMQPLNRMQASGIMMQLDFLRSDTRSYATQILQSQPVGGKLIEQLDPLGSIFLNGVELP